MIVLGCARGPEEVVLVSSEYVSVPYCYRTNIYRKMKIEEQNSDAEQKEFPRVAHVNKIVKQTKVFLTLCKVVKAPFEFINVVKQTYLDVRLPLLRLPQFNQESRGVFGNISL